MQSILAWAYAHPELAVAAVGLLVNAVCAAFKLFGSNRYVAFVAKMVAAVFPDPAEIVDAFRKFLAAGPGGPKAPDALPTRPYLADEKENVLKISDPINGAMPKSHMAPSGVFMRALFLACLVFGLGCLPAKDVHDLMKLSVDELDCVMTHADSGEEPQAIIVACGLASIPDVLKLVEDLVTTERAAHKAGVSWKPLAAKDAGADR